MVYHKQFVGSTKPSVPTCEGCHISFQDRMGQGNRVTAYVPNISCFCFKRCI